jgi:hypothetical protein
LDFVSYVNSILAKPAADVPRQMKVFAEDRRLVHFATNVNLILITAPTAGGAYMMRRQMVDPAVKTIRLALIFARRANITESASH